MIKLRCWLRTIVVVWLTTVFLGEIAYAGVELISNGDFSSGFEAWEKGGYYMGGGSPLTPNSSQVSIVDDSPNAQTVKLTGVSGSNYYIIVSQEVNLTSDLFCSFDISFDWKVTEKESSYGATYIRISFLNEEDVRIGYVSYWDIANDAHSISYWRGDLEENQFIGVRKYREVFDWESVSVNT